ncbi:hypothetical protein [Haemophilus parahaemolyticus]|uniref:hypothetical protein n=1 Tax=Haemophilus parahaemolyticus TaxID=735 RepID=UPI002889618B|nr:hypothetical protein [Haemophilus parahaemolyticus]
MPKYQLTLTEKQAQIVQDACELYERLHAGQWFALEPYLKLKPDHYFWQVENCFHYFIEPYLELDKMNFERNAGDIMNVIRHRLSWDKYPEGGKTVNFREPMKFGEEPLPEIKRIEEHHLIHQKK